MIKPKAQYSSSSPMLTTMYHLAIYDGTENMRIVENSSVKRLLNDGVVMLNDDRTAKLKR